MRVVELSDHPASMRNALRAQRAQEEAAEQARHADAVRAHSDRLALLRSERDLARAQRRWLTWLRGSLRVWATHQGPAMPARRPGGMVTREEAIVDAGIDGERQVTAVLADHLGDDWTLFRGYRNRGGEIDHLILGARGLLAVEVKYRNAMVHCDGDAWWFDKYDRYGNIVEQGELSDRGGRSPSRQLNDPADALQAFLSSRGQAVAILRVVLFTHARSALGTLTAPTVDLIGTSATHVIEFLDGLPPSVQPGQLTQLEQLILRDHRFHARGPHGS